MLLSPPDTQAAALIAGLVEEKTGIFFAPNRYEILLDKLQPRMRECECSTLLDYYYLLRYDPGAEAEWQRIYTALAVNETYFWREFDQIRAITQILIPDLARCRPGQPVRIWHAACASGEEPYTLIMALKETRPDLLGRIQVTATDLNPEALRAAALGVYRQRSFRALAPDLLARYFSPVGDGRFRIHDEIRAHVTLQQMNLMD